MKKKVLVGMSGGVDSSVTAYLLKKQGYEVIGVTMQIWQNDSIYEEMEGGCCSLSSVEDARRVAYNLGIPFYVMDFKEEFKEHVVDYFSKEYLKGRTPNPCIACNKHIKFDLFLKKALKMGIDYIATGHYCIIEKKKDRYIIRKSKDSKKDQTYVLYNFTQFQLSKTLMPCGEYNKDEIRKIAKEIGLDVYNKKDSEEICFIPDNNHGGYIKRNYKDKVKEGNFVDKDGKILGKHKGIVYYTIGQRKGLNISFGKPMYVIDINTSQNQVVLGEIEDLYKEELIAKEVNYIPFKDLEEPMEVEAKIRYSQKSFKAKIIPLPKNKVKVLFFEKQRAVTKGQSVVFYKEDLLIGGGIIE